MGGQSAQVLQQLLFFALLVVGFYLLAIRPQRQRTKALADVQASLEVGSRVMTTAGIHATVVRHDDQSVLLEVADGVRVTFATAAVVRVLDEDVDGTPPGGGRRRSGRS